MKLPRLVLFAVFSALCPVAPAQAVKLILDTDYRTDVDDPGTLAMLHGLANLGRVEIVGVIASTSGADVIGAVDAVNTYCGRPHIPIGLCPPALGSTGPDPYAATIANASVYPHDQTNATAPDAVKLYRALLHANVGKDIVICVVGGQNVLRALMTSPANYQGDGIPYTGMQLISAKVASLSIMGGNFLNGAVENNIVRGLGAAQQVASQWPGPIVYSGWEVGNQVPTGAVLANPSSNPVAKAYEVFSGSGPVGTIGNRDSWDQTSALQAVVGLEWQGSRIWDLSAPQSIAFDSTGKSVYSANPSGNRYHLIKRMANAGIATIISNLMRDGTTPPPAPAPTGGLLAWYSFEDYSGLLDPGAPITNQGEAGSVLDLTDTGGPDGRDNTGAGGYRATGLAGHGYAFDVLASGDGTRHAGTSGAAQGGGLLTSAAVPQSALQGADGAFTYEAFIKVSEISSEQTILSHDGVTTRGFLFRVTGGRLSLYTGATEVAATIPVSGAHAFVPGTWFHVAVAYDGAEGVANNTRFYWTALGGSPSQANLIGSATLAADIANTSNLLGVGTTTRGHFRYELGGLIDEVGISNRARGAGEFGLSAPLPVDADGDGMPDAWETEHGLNPNADDRLGDPDGDGLPNLLEFAFGLDPRARDSNAMPVVAVESDYLTMTVARNPTATGLRFIPEVSDDLVSWKSGAGWVVVIEETPALLRVRDALPIGGNARRFIRLRVEPPVVP